MPTGGLIVRCNDYVLFIKERSYKYRTADIANFIQINNETGLFGLYNHYFMYHGVSTLTKIIRRLADPIDQDGRDNQNKYCFRITDPLKIGLQEVLKPYDPDHNDHIGEINIPGGKFSGIPKGGKLDFDVDLRATAIREFIEETGYNLTDVQRNQIRVGQEIQLEHGNRAYVWNINEDTARDILKTYYKGDNHARVDQTNGTITVVNGPGYTEYQSFYPMFVHVSQINNDELFRTCNGQLNDYATFNPAALGLNSFSNQAINSLYRPPGMLHANIPPLPDESPRVMPFDIPNHPSVLGDACPVVAAVLVSPGGAGGGAGENTAASSASPTAGGAPGEAELAAAIQASRETRIAEQERWSAPPGAENIVKSIQSKAKAMMSGTQDFQVRMLQRLLAEYKAKAGEEYPGVDANEALAKYGKRRQGGGKRRTYKVKRKNKRSSRRSYRRSRN